MAPRMNGSNINSDGGLVVVGPGLCIEPPGYNDTVSLPDEVYICAEIPTESLLRAPVRSMPAMLPSYSNTSRVGLPVEVICTEIPSESLWRAPVRSMPAMPSRLSLSARAGAPLGITTPLGISRQPLAPQPALQAIFVEPAVWQDENLSVVALEATTPRTVPIMSRPSVGASHGLSRPFGLSRPSGLSSQRPGTRRMRPARPTWQPPAPPQGDSTCTYSRSNSNASVEPDDLDTEDDNEPQGRQASRISSHEEIANEEPLAQMPVRVWFRSPRIRDIEGVDAESAESHPGIHTIEGNYSHPSSWQVADELGHTGGMAAPRYLLVRLGECIPAETGAAPVHLSRLDTGPQWRDFLNYGEGRDPRGYLALDELLTCPCCISIYRQPVALPCGHSLCRGCFARISSQVPQMRRCPLCRADFPQGDFRVNLALSAVCDSLRAFRALQAATRGPPVFRLNNEEMSLNAQQNGTAPQERQIDSANDSPHTFEDVHFEEHMYSSVQVESPDDLLSDTVGDLLPAMASNDFPAPRNDDDVELAPIPEGLETEDVAERTSAEEVVERTSASES